jgi:riboflavin kinase/FMN adenylyltransferase
VAWVNGSSHAAAINLGPSPTFGDAVVRVEVHVIDYHESLYGEPLEVDFVARLRDIRPFDSPAALIAQLRQDVEQAKRIVTT